MSSQITLDQLQSYLWNSAVLLRSHVDAGSYKQYIFPLLFFKRICDVYDEECEQILQEYDGNTDALEWPENHMFVVPQGAHWNDVRNATQDIGIELIGALSAIERANNDKLSGVFGNAAWTNKARLPDALLKDMIEHFSSMTLSLKNCPEDELGQGYEYLIRKFADDAGHTAQEFYTNRTVVHLMTEMLKPQSGETVYDPTCGTAGMLISCIAYLKRKDQEWRNVRLYGQEITQLTAAIAKMNLFLHGIKDFEIINDDTLKRPGFLDHGKLRTFDMVLANPPYSIKTWDRDAFASDIYGRNFLGVPPQGRADYAFFQHILKSMDPNTGRCAILFPHGVLFRDEESSMRQKLVESDLVECVIGLGPNLFYNSPMEACVVICRSQKPADRQNKVMFINAVDQVTRKNAQSYLEEKHITKIANAYEQFADIDGFAKVATTADIQKNEFILNIPLYAPLKNATTAHEFHNSSDAHKAWMDSSDKLNGQIQILTGLING